jgi:hypothetical protein
MSPPAPPGTALPFNGPPAAFFYERIIEEGISEMRTAQPCWSFTGEETSFDPWGTGLR